MARPRTIPDPEIFAAIRAMLAQGGDKAVAFSSVARATGLAAPTLVQRYGSREGMVKAALLSAWDDLDARTDAAEAAAPLNAKGAVALLKALNDDEGGPDDLGLLAVEFRDPALRARAEAWRTRVEAALATRLGGGGKGRELAAILFAAWQGQALWSMAGGRGFRLKDALKRLD
ncbi:TetR/AcrR family transcriptional regulator [Neotabrizicola shimadae]|uniref:TetR family transcriptional regulator n=1 Tax=Neotabrizicola shimadae TaxID=2807096 RepID=A0A8G0ZVL9_9RHOB|nr:TetR family transcriptional regulator [Neotabrizicola shimadae]QYZ69711.1 TetR family transcriptional regulator [Neotabrizicola shimadae]